MDRPITLPLAHACRVGKKKMGTQSASNAPAMWLHGLELHLLIHNCGTSTRCCSNMVTSYPERDVCTTAVGVTYH